MDFENCRVYMHGQNANTGEPIYDVRDYPDILGRSGTMKYGSIEHYFWGNYFVSESGQVLWADCYLKADSHLITGAYDVYVNAPSHIWAVSATGQCGGAGLPRNYWIGSRPPFLHNITKVPVTFIKPSRLKKLLAPLEDCHTPARAVASLILGHLAELPDDVVWQIENDRHDFARKWWGI